MRCPGVRDDCSTAAPPPPAKLVRNTYGIQDATYTFIYIYIAQHDLSSQLGAGNSVIVVLGRVGKSDAFPGALSLHALRVYVLLRHSALSKTFVVAALPSYRSSDGWLTDEREGCRRRVDRTYSSDVNSIARPIGSGDEWAPSEHEVRRSRSRPNV